MDDILNYMCIYIYNLSKMLAASTAGRFLSECSLDEELTKIDPGSIKNRARGAKNAGPEGVWEIGSGKFLGRSC